MMSFALQKSTSDLSLTKHFIPTSSLWHLRRVSEVSGDSSIKMFKYKLAITMFLLTTWGILCTQTNHIQNLLLDVTWTSGTLVGNDSIMLVLGLVATSMRQKQNGPVYQWGASSSHHWWSWCTASSARHVVEVQSLVFVMIIIHFSASYIEKCIISSFLCLFISVRLFFLFLQRIAPMSHLKSPPSRKQLALSSHGEVHGPLNLAKRTKKKTYLQLLIYMIMTTR